jgi:hypothetical protein
VAADSLVPYLSVVVTTRNDDHGGDPLERLQAFVNVFDAQCRQTGLDAEVIVVEWNPPPERPSVGSLLRLPDPPFCTYRFIEVPPELHNTLQYADVLPLFQMIAKNVGIRRARGQFVLATNIDIILSTELVEHIAALRLDAGSLYRVDRHDIQSDFPVDAPLDQQMEFCRDHQLRVHTRLGSFQTAPDGSRVSLPEDIVDGRSIRLGEGWHVREGTGPGDLFRWAGDRVGLLVDLHAAALASVPCELEVEIDANPYSLGLAVDITAAEEGRTLVEARVTGRVCVRIPLARLEERCTRRIELRATTDLAASRRQLPVFERRDGMVYRVHSARLRPAAAATATFDYSAYAHVRSSLPMMSTREGLRIASNPRRYSYCVQLGPFRLRTAGRYRFDQTFTLLAGGISLGVLNADQTSWLNADVRQHQDRAHPSSRRFEVAIEAQSEMQFWLVITNEHPQGEGVSEFVLHRMTGDHDPSSLLHGGAPLVAAWGSLSRAVASAYARMLGRPQLVGGVRSAPRLRRYISRIADLVARGVMLSLGSRVRYRLVRATTEFRDVEQILRESDRQLRELARLRDLSDFNGFLGEHRPDNLHVNGCGDFHLMARAHWDVLRAYAEFQTFSMNIDGLLSYVAHAAGIKEEILGVPIYHLEHEVGSGWSPEGEAVLRKRIAERGITWLDASTIYIWAAYMKWLKQPMIFNSSKWGMGDIVLTERTMRPTRVGN